MAAVQLNGIYKRYGETQVVHGIDLDIDDGEFVVLVGPSGCGKSTLMRMIAGLEEITGGELMIGGTRANTLAPQQRNVSMVFQSYALYPHLSVYDNIAFGPRIRKEPTERFKPRIEAAAKMLNLTGYLDRLPRALSGGQRQRVAMGRAVVREPALFLFDEPLSNLDAKLRNEMRVEIKKLHRKLGATMIYVTHDQVEAMTLADRIAVLSGGYVVQYGTPDEIYNAPRTTFVAGFTGSPPMNLLELNVSGSVAKAGGIEIPIPETVSCSLVGTIKRRVTFGVRPECVALADDSQPVSGPVCHVRARVVVTEPLGAETLCTFDAGGQNLVARLAPDVQLEPGTETRLAIALSKSHWFDIESGVTLMPRNVN